MSDKWCRFNSQTHQYEPLDDDDPGDFTGELLTAEGLTLDPEEERRLTALELAVAACTGTGRMVWGVDLVFSADAICRYLETGEVTPANG